MYAPETNQGFSHTRESYLTNGSIIALRYSKMGLFGG